MSYNSEALTQSCIGINWEVSNRSLCLGTRVYYCVPQLLTQLQCEPGLKTPNAGWAWETTVILLSLVLSISQRQKGKLRTRVERWGGVPFPLPPHLHSIPPQCVTTGSSCLPLYTCKMGMCYTLSCTPTASLFRTSSERE